MELFKNANYDILGSKKPFIIGSLVLTVAGLTSMAFKGGLAFGIDFRGGAVMYVRFVEKPSEDRIRSVLSQKIKGEITVQPVVGENEVMIGTELQGEKGLEEARRTMVETLATAFGQPASNRLDLNNIGQAALAERLREALAQAGQAVPDSQLQNVVRAILNYRDTPPRSGVLRSVEELSAVPEVQAPVLAVLKQAAYTSGYAIRNTEIVGPKIGRELRNQAVYATLLALLGMLVYIAFRFEWVYGAAAVVAVFHDVLITLGLFSIANKEISLTVIAALLTLVGYSMNDTIVVFDRIRENLRILRREEYSKLVNLSINQTLSRTILTSGLTFLTALSLWLFGGPVLNGFAFALVVGILVGTYSSIFIASPIVVWWNDFVNKRKRPAAAVPAPAIRGAAKSAK